MSEIQYARFAINDTPCCVWDWDIPNLNLQFIESIDAGYFDHLAEVYQRLLGGDDQQYAAIALRSAYSHGLETFFALIGATVQAPNCVPGWLLKYQNNELNEVVRKIHNRRPILSMLPISSVSWDSLASTILLFDTGDDVRNREIRDAFSRLWYRFASEFLDEDTHYEYNR